MQVNWRGTLLRFAQRRLHVLEPADLGVDGAGVPDALVDAVRLEEGVLQRRRTGDGEVGTLLEVLAPGLWRRWQWQPEMLGCRIGQRFPSEKGGEFTWHHRMLLHNVQMVMIHKGAMLLSEELPVRSIFPKRKRKRDFDWYQYSARAQAAIIHSAAKQKPFHQQFSTARFHLFIKKGRKNHPFWPHPYLIKRLASQRSEELKQRNSTFINKFL